MALKICARLGLPKPVKFVKIQDIASKHEINRARQIRLKEGKHIVPVPTVELNHILSGILVDLPHHQFSRKEKVRSAMRSQLSDLRSVTTGSWQFLIMLSLTLLIL